MQAAGLDTTDSINLLYLFLFDDTSRKQKTKFYAQLYLSWDMKISEQPDWLLLSNSWFQI